MISKGLRRKHFTSAAAEIDKNGVPTRRKSCRYDLFLNGKTYPPKYIISIANKYLNGTELSSKKFSAIEAKDYLLGKGYNVLDRKKEEVLSGGWTDKFPGGVPPGVYFQIEIDDLTGLVSKNDKSKRINRVTHLAYIGLLSYFEAFCKDQFASLINICPELIISLKENQQDVNIDASEMLKYKNSIIQILGCLIAEKYNFGTAKKINALYNALLRITPFTKKDVNRFSNILKDRNLLVHHGGIYTTKYLNGETAFNVLDGSRVFMDSLVITNDRFKEDAEFMKGITKKIIRTSHDALKRVLIEKGKLDGSAISSLLMLRGGHETDA